MVEGRPESDIQESEDNPKFKLNFWWVIIGGVIGVPILIILVALLWWASLKSSVESGFEDLESCYYDLQRYYEEDENTAGNGVAHLREMIEKVPDIGFYRSSYSYNQRLAEQKVITFLIIIPVD